ncbi:TPA: hypothetical protein ACH3X1_000604 [Trebouxia sp. C0004]
MTSFVLQGNQKRKVRKLFAQVFYENSSSVPFSVVQSASCTAFWLVLVLCRLEGQGMSMQVRSRNNGKDVLKPITQRRQLWEKTLQEMYPLLTLIAVRLLSLCNFLRS